MAAKVRLFSICAVELKLTRSDPPQLAVTVHGYAASTGWTDPELVPLEKKLSVDGILDLAFVGTPPAAINLPALTPQTAGLVWTDDVDRLIGVRVVSRTNEIVRLVVEDAAQATTEPVGEETTQIAGEGLHPHFAAAARAAPTTLAVGEEEPGISTMAGTEETVFTTLMLGEEGGGLPPTHLLGEHGGGLPPTTHLLGEEHGGYPPTTHMLGEEGGGLPPTTHMLGEEGGGLPPTTHMLGEEGGGLPPGAEAVAAPRQAGPTTTAPLIEETTQIAGEGREDPPITPIVGEAGGPPHITTEIQGEEHGGGGTVFTTLVYGEESGGGGTTAPWFEEMMPGPVIPPGGTGREQAAMTTMVVGEEGTTPMFGEEHGGYPPTTHMLGEEGGGLPPTTLVAGEEGPGGTTAPLIEETTQIVGEGPHPTTPAVGEEGWYDPQNQNPLGRR